MDSTIKAIQTTYNGIRFRSRTEARWAVFMDTVGISYVYEPEGFVFEDGTTYSPDFYLPGQDAFLECKGIMHDDDIHKVKMLFKHYRKEIIVGYPNMTFDVFDECFQFKDCMSRSKMPWIAKCKICGKKYFLSGEHNINVCRCCSKSWKIDDEEITTTVLYGYFDESKFINRPEISKAFEKAKSARFEFGEDGTNG